MATVRPRSVCVSSDRGAHSLHFCTNVLDIVSQIYKVLACRHKHFYLPRIAMKLVMVAALLFLAAQVYVRLCLGRAGIGCTTVLLMWHIIYDWFVFGCRLPVILRIPSSKASPHGPRCRGASPCTRFRRRLQPVHVYIRA